MKNQATQVIFILAVVVPLATTALVGQDCTLTLSGNVYDQFTQDPLSLTHILVEETGTGEIADSLGYFKISNLCPGVYHLHISHLGCEAIHYYLNLEKDTFLVFYLEHTTEFLHDVTIEGKKTSATLQAQSTLSSREINQNSGKTLSELVAKVNGVRLIKNGSGITKPIIHGLYGNRISVVNHGLIQTSQNWGNDHAPEIDPFSANQISVVKGVGTIRYGGDGLGGMIKIDQSSAPSDPHLHGTVNYSYQSNGKIHSLASTLEKGGPSFKYRANGSIKYGGDRTAPQYYLTNTGVREKNLSVRINNTINEKWLNDMYISLFNSQLGILKGSHVGNLTDLEEAFVRQVPLFTNDHFSYDLEAPRQKVNHSLIKMASKYFLDNSRFIEFTYGGQFNQRSEFDIRRGNRSDIPALKLSLNSHFLEGIFTNNTSSVGLQYRYTKNKNGPETGILPLIPDYLRFNPSGFFIKTWENEMLSAESGFRYDFNYLKVTRITRNRMIEKNTHYFHKVGFSGAVSLRHKKTFIGKINAGYVLRAPQVNELYSLGLHQGVAGIEEGNPNLKSESGIKILFNGKATLSRIFIETSIYSHFIQNYIFLEPQTETRLTIRGAFPVFLYKQTDATLTGFDLNLKVEPLDGLIWRTQFSTIRGTNRRLQEPLVYIPSDRLSSQLSLALSKSSLETVPSMGIEATYVFKQKNLLEHQDFLPSPPGYFLFKFAFETELPWIVDHLNFSFEVENLFNSSYRDYLDRLRYYSDAQGRSINVRLHYRF